MPELGEIKRGREIGKDHYGRYEWRACLDCGLERWVKVRENSLRCWGCAHKGKELSEETRLKISQALTGNFQPKGDKAHNWRGGRFKNSKGYILVKLQPDDFFYRCQILSGLCP